MMVGLTFGAVLLWMTLIPIAGITAQKQKLVVWQEPGHHYKAYDEVYAEFERKNPTIDVDVEFYRWGDYRPKVYSKFAIGNPPDLMELSPWWDIEFAVQGFLEPMTDRFARWGEKDDFFAIAVEQNTYNGELWSIPWHLTNMALYYNKDLFEEAGFIDTPKNWTEFLGTAIKLTRDIDGDGKIDVWGYPVSSNVMWFWPWPYQNGGKFYDPEINRVVLDSPEAIGGLQFLVDLIYKWKVGPKPTPEGYIGYAESTRRLFIVETSAMYISGPWDIKPIRAANPDLNFMTARLPEGKKRFVPTYGVDLAIAKVSKVKDKAWELIKMLTSLETELKVTKETGMIMPRKSWAKSSLVQQMELAKPFVEQMAYAELVQRYVVLSGHPEIYTTMVQTAFESALYGEKTAKEALVEYTKEANELIEKEPPAWLK